jgi:hypothetical protein
MSEAVEIRFWKHANKGEPDDCWEWVGHRAGRMRYGALRVDSRYEMAHRLSFLFAFGWSPQYVLHKCDNPPCVNPRHLFAGTIADNSRDMVNKWRKPGKVTPAVKSTIFALHECGMKQRAIANQVGLNQATVGRVLRGKIRYGPVETL